MTFHEKPGRPLGVTLAILISVFLFSFLPLIYSALILTIRGRIYAAPEIPGFGGGSDILGLDERALIVQAILGLTFLVVAVFAWRGRPPLMRFVFVTVVVALTFITIMVNLWPAITATCSQLPCDSSTDLGRTLAAAEMPLFILVPLYVVWYMNRAPARAFYRGYYLTDKAERPTTKPAL